MYNFDIADYGHLSTYSRNAEIKILDLLLNEPFFLKRTTLHRNLAWYPNASFFDKNKIIATVMELVWGGTDTFETFRAFDHFLSVSKRGHYVHQFEVFLLGMNIILLAKGKGKLGAFGFEDIEQVIYAWLFTASAHDFGYPVESVDKVVGKLAKLYDDFGLKSLSSRLNDLQIKNIIEGEPEFNRLVISQNSEGDPTFDINDIGEIVYKEVVSSLVLSDGEENCVRELQERLIKESNHGYVSGIMLFRTVIHFMVKNVDVADIKSSWMFSALKKAIAAVTLHSLAIDDKKDDSFYIRRISFDKNQFSYLLYIIDNIQDWGRSIFPDVQEKWAEYHLNDYRVIDGNTLELDYKISHEHWDEKSSEQVKSFLLCKKKMLSLPRPASARLDLKIKVLFTTNLGSSYASIVIDM